jgi:streptogramin lyase
MRLPTVRRGVLIATCVASLGLPGLLVAPVAGAAPVGIVRELHVHGFVTDLTAGPEGDVWFTQSPALGERGVIAIGRISPGGKVRKFTRGLSPAAEPLFITAGADGNLWFTFVNETLGLTGGGVGRITPTGTITLFSEPAGFGGAPFEIVSGPDGNVWFDHAAIFSQANQAIGRITPAGEITEFSAGLGASGEVSNLSAGGSGNVWFGDRSSEPAIGQVTPAGLITKSGPPVPDGAIKLEGPTTGPDGNVYFAVNGDRAGVERISPAGVVERFRKGLSPRTEEVGPFGGGVDGNVWFGIVRSPPKGQPDDAEPTPGIGRITPGGAITEYDKCLRPMPYYAGPSSFTPGSDGNVWFVTQPSGESADPRPSSTPSIGRVTPSGKITEFRYGLSERSAPEHLVAAGGKLWFVDGETESIGEIVPPRAPANTFLLLYPRLRRGTHVTVLPAYVPGPGKLRLRVVGLRVGGGPEESPAGQVSYSAPASACGEVGIPVFAGRPLDEKLQRGVAVELRVRVTFTPRGGSPFSRETTMALVAGKPRH